jgi:hypothetical protein
MQFLQGQLRRDINGFARQSRVNRVLSFHGRFRDECLFKIEQTAHFGSFRLISAHFGVWPPTSPAVRSIKRPRARMGVCDAPEREKGVKGCNPTVLPHG